MRVRFKIENVTVLMKIGDGKKTWSEVKHLNISKNDKDK